MSMATAIALGDYVEDFATLNFMFAIPRDDTGAPIVLAGSPVISVYKGSNTTQRTSAEADITLDIDYDSVVGLNHVLINLSTDAFFVAGEDYTVVLTTGTVNSVVKVGLVLATFSIEARSQQATNDAVLAGTVTNAAGADVAADIIAVKSQTADIETDTAVIGALGVGLSDLGGMSTAMKAEVNVEAKDVIVTDTQAELAQGAPAIVASLATMIKTMYKFAIAKQTQTSSTLSIFNSDESTVAHKSTVSDDGTTATKGEIKTGP